MKRSKTKPSQCHQKRILTGVRPQIRTPLSLLGPQLANQKWSPLKILSPRWSKRKFEVKWSHSTVLSNPSTPDMILFSLLHSFIKNISEKMRQVDKRFTHLSLGSHEEGCSWVLQEIHKGK